jgi:hypothetical protein
VPDSTRVIADLDVLITAPHGLWIFCEEGDRLCRVVRSRRGGVWETEPLIAGCDAAPRFFSHARGDTLRTVISMARGDAIRIGVFASNVKPPEPIKREEFLKLIRWSSAVVFDSSKAVSMSERAVRGRYGVR